MYNDGPSIIIAQWVLFGGACGAVAIRYGACRRPQYGFWWDDMVVSVALILFCATCVTGTLACAWGVGKYVPDVNPPDLPKSTLFGIISTDLGMLADSVSKVAVALLIVRLFYPRIWTKWAMIAGTLLNVLFNVLLVIFSFVQCTPEKYQWNRTTMSGKCWNIDVYVDFAYFTGAWTAFLDIFFSIYPLFVVSQLQMKWRKKFAVMATMSFGFGTFAVTTYKVATQYPLFKQGSVDATRILGSIMFWNAVGIAFTIIAGSIPTWGWLFRTSIWRNIIYVLSGGRISSSRRTSASALEKFPFTVNSNQPSPAGSRQLTPATTRNPSQDDGPIIFPERSHCSYQSERSIVPPVPTIPRVARHSMMPSRPFSLTRGPPAPMDSLQQLERSTWS